MPTNLPSECAEIEARYRAATSAGEKIACLEELITAIPKAKGYRPPRDPPDTPKYTTLNTSLSPPQILSESLCRQLVMP